MLPESTSVVFRPDLQAMANEYDTAAAQVRFIGKRVAPIFKSNIVSAQYPIFRRAALKKMTDDRKTPKGTYNRIQGYFGASNYNCDTHGLEYPIDDKKKMQYGSLFNAEAAATTILTQQLLMNHESRVHSLIYNAGATNHNVTTAWSTSASAVPLTDIGAGIIELKHKSGVGENRISLVIPEDDLTELCNCTQVVDKCKYTYSGNSGIQPSQITPLMLAGMLGIKEVLVGESVYDSTSEGYAESVSDLWTAGLIYLIVTCPENAPLETPSTCRTVLWDAMTPNLPTISSYRSDETEADIVKAKAETDEILLLDDADLMIYQITNT